MYQTSIDYKLKTASSDNHYRILYIFFKAWIDESCENKVEYVNTSQDTIRVEFEQSEDATALKLRGVPDEFQNYLEIVY